jgi:hypothetical protein
MWAQKNKWQTSLQNHFHGNPLNIFAKDLELFLLQNEFFFELLSYMSYMYMRKHHKRIVQSGGEAPRWKDTFSIHDKGGEIYQMQRTEAWFQGEHIYQMQRTEKNLSDTEDRDMVSGEHE